MAVERAADAFVAPGAALIGDVRLGAESSVWFGAVLRGEAGPVELDARANVQDNCLVEARPGQPVRIGAGVSLGHNARVLGATIGELCLIAMGASVLPGAHVEARCIIAANATVPEGMRVPAGSLVIGSGRISRQVTQAEHERIERGAREYARLTREYLTGVAGTGTTVTGTTGTATARSAPP